MAITRVHLTAGDKVGWAIDEDLRLVRDSLAGVCEITSLARAEAVHSGWWVNLLPYSPADFRGKHVVCTAENSPFYYITEPEFLKARRMVTQWIVRSREGAAQFAALGLPSRYAPYTFDPAVFFPLPANHPELCEMVRRWKIPTDQYLIANFHRDTEGSDLQSPKIQKGPDVFLEIVARLWEQGEKFHVLLAGPRRFWLRRQLAARGVPFTFVGEDTGSADDLAANTLPRTTLNVLYSIADLHIVSSRWEGGPQSVLESAATRCKIISTRVGLAPDVLEPECLFSTVFAACEIVRGDLRSATLDATVESQFSRANSAHTAPELRRHLQEIYRSLEPRTGAPTNAIARSRRALQRAAGRVFGRFKTPSPVRSIAVLHRSADSAGNAFDGFIERLCEELKRRGCAIGTSAMADADAVLIGRVPAGDPLLPDLSPHHTPPVIGILDDDAAAAGAFDGHCKHCACVLVSSIDALVHLRAQGLPPERALVIPPAASTEAPDPANDDNSVVKPGDAWAGARIQRALARGEPLAYPAASLYEYAVWFGGLTFADDAERIRNSRTLHDDRALFARLAAPVTLASVADRILRTAAVCRELLSYTDDTERSHSGVGHFAESILTDEHHD